jgi:exodeoxyribonuclease-5
MNKENIWMPKWLSPRGPVPYMFTTIRLEDDDTFDYVPIDYTCLTTGETFLTPQQTYKLNRNKNFIEAPYEFAYAYGMTVWKAQGSQWPKVMVFEEWFPNEAEEHARFLYTAATRAEEKLLIVKK